MKKFMCLSILMVTLVEPLNAYASSDLNELKFSAHTGNAISEYELGQKYRTGDEVDKNLETAFCWLHRSAEHGYILSWLSVGMMYELGEGVARDEVEAYKWFDLTNALTPSDWPADVRRFAVEDQAETAKHMSADQIEKAKNRAHRWWESVVARGKPASDQQYAPNPNELPDCPSE